MTFSKQKAEKLVTEFDYLKTKPYFPYGKEGKKFKITELKSVAEKTKRTPENMAKALTDKNFFEQSDLKLSKGNNWFVKVIISDNDITIEKDLTSVLERLEIQHDIDKIPN